MGFSRQEYWSELTCSPPGDPPNAEMEPTVSYFSAFAGRLFTRASLKAQLAENPPAMQEKWSEVAQSCPTPCDPVDCSPPGSSAHGILQARILEWFANAGDPGFNSWVGKICWRRIDYPLQYSWVSLVAQLVKNLPAMRETWVQSWVGEISWRREKLPTPVFWPGEFHGLRSIGSQRVGQDWAAFTFTFSLLLAPPGKPLDLEIHSFLGPTPSDFIQDLHFFLILYFLEQF